MKTLTAQKNYHFVFSYVLWKIVTVSSYLFNFFLLLLFHLKDLWTRQKKKKKNKSSLAVRPLFWAIVKPLSVPFLHLFHFPLIHNNLRLKKGMYRILTPNCSSFFTSIGLSFGLRLLSETNKFLFAITFTVSFLFTARNH